MTFCDSSSRLCPCRRTGDTNGCEHAQPAEVLSDAEIEDAWWGELDNRSLGCIRNIIARAIERAVLAQPSGGDERAAFELWVSRQDALARARQSGDDFLTADDAREMEPAFIAGAGYARAALAQQQGLDAGPVFFISAEAAEMLRENVGKIFNRGVIKGSTYPVGASTVPLFIGGAAIAAARGE